MNVVQVLQSYSCTVLLYTAITVQSYSTASNHRALRRRKKVTHRLMELNWCEQLHDMPCLVKERMKYKIGVKHVLHFR